VGVVTRDRTDPPAPGAYGICYLNAFQTQPGTLRWWRRHHPRLLLRDDAGGLVADRDWPGEYLLDTSTAGRRRGIARVVGRWIRSCAGAGYAAVEPDNLDSWTRSSGLLARRDNADLARRLVARGHRAGLAVAQKNDRSMLRLRRGIGFDFVVVEECHAYRECGAFLRAYGAAVIEIEYGDGTAYAAACRARGQVITIVHRDRDLVPAGRPGYVFATC
jgi:hypothetical protein